MGWVNGADASRDEALRECQWCHGPIAEKARSDAKTCSKKCRQAKQRFRVGVAPRSSGTSMRFAYADPPYPGLAHYYGDDGHEVNHRILIETLREYFPDGWALSTSAKALQGVLALCPADARVCSWVKGRQSSLAKRPHSAWEPLIVVGGRTRRITAKDNITDALLWGSRQHSHPGALIGMKSAAFCEWTFQQLGAEQGDTLTDVFSGSGAVGRAWGLYQNGGTPGQSRISEAQERLAAECRASTRTETMLKKRK